MSHTLHAGSHSLKSSATFASKSIAQPPWGASEPFLQAAVLTRWLIASTHTQGPTAMTVASFTYVTNSLSWLQEGWQQGSGSAGVAVSAVSQSSASVSPSPSIHHRRATAQVLTHTRCCQGRATQKLCSQLEHVIFDFGCCRFGQLMQHQTQLGQATCCVLVSQCVQLPVWQQSDVAGDMKRVHAAWWKCSCSML